MSSSTTRSKQQEAEAQPEAEAEAEQGTKVAEEPIPEGDLSGPNSNSSSLSECANDEALAEAKGSLKIHAWNIRSISNPTNKHAVALHL